jgi:hypothetical protein
MHDEYGNGKYTYSTNHLPLRGTSVPYWSHECGIKINTFDEFVSAFEKMYQSYKDFNPRNYVLNVLSPAVCMNRILSYFNLSLNN